MPDVAFDLGGCCASNSSMPGVLLDHGCGTSDTSMPGDLGFCAFINAAELAVVGAATGGRGRLTNDCECGDARRGAPLDRRGEGRGDSGRWITARRDRQHTFFTEVHDEVRGGCALDVSLTSAAKVRADVRDPLGGA
jgi:hypothetical protein